MVYLSSGKELAAVLERVYQRCVAPPLAGDQLKWHLVLTR
jgi:hypothetical protein